MAQPAAKQGDQIVAVDIHIILVPSASGAVPTPIPHPFNGILDSNLSTTVMIMGKPAATVGSIATNTPAHIPQGGSFSVPPTNKGNVTMGSTTVMINGKPAARNGDAAITCQEAGWAMPPKVVAVGTVLIG